MSKTGLSLIRRPATWILALFLAAACVPSQMRVPSQGSSTRLKGYTRIALTPGKRQFAWKSAGIEVTEADRVLVLVSLEKNDFKHQIQWQIAGATARIGDSFRRRITDYRAYFTPEGNGTLQFGSGITLGKNSNVQRYEFVVDVFVVDRQADAHLPAILRQMSENNPEDPYLRPHLAALRVFDPSKMEHMSDQALVQTWRDTILFPIRADVVRALEQKGAASALAGCYQAYLETPEQFDERDPLTILEAFGRLKDPEVITVLGRTPYLKKPEEAILFLKVLREIGDREGMELAGNYVDAEKQEVSLQAIDTIGGLAGAGDVGRIYPYLYHQNPDIRWKAIKILGRIEGPEAASRINILLADENATVRGVARFTLLNLGIPKETVSSWEKKAAHMSIDEAYRSSVALQRAEAEKELLQKRLQSERDVKIRLQESLEMKEDALKNQERVLEDLYEKERQLKSMQFQLAGAQTQAADYREQMAKLERQATALTDDLAQASSASNRVDNQEALDRVMAEKARLEKMADELGSKKSRLRQEFDALKASTAKMREAADRAREQVEALRGRESELVGQVEALKERLNRGMAPVVVVSRPDNGSVVETETIVLQFVAVDDRGIAGIEVFVNGRATRNAESGRGVQVASLSTQAAHKKSEQSRIIHLVKGRNKIQINVVDTDGSRVTETVTVTRKESRGRIWAAIVGIDGYEKVRPLKYAVNDAKAFRTFLLEHLGVPETNIFTLLNQEATKSQVQSLMGTQLKKKAAKDDTVYIYYAGHGAVEPDPANPDGDGFEKYLLPYDADLEDLYSSSISMKEVRTIFQRIAAERLVFIADTCYSGASGGRTLLSRSTRATLSERFFERLSQGKGRIILSASSANEISQEIDAFRHGVFTYYLLQGLKGKADRDGDGLITVGEVFSYVSRHVPDATGQDQHPVKKGESEGEIIIGRIK